MTNGSHFLEKRGECEKKVEEGSTDRSHTSSVVNSTEFRYKKTPFFYCHIFVFRFFLSLLSYFSSFSYFHLHTSTSPTVLLLLPIFHDPVQTSSHPPLLRQQARTCSHIRHVPCCCSRRTLKTPTLFPTNHHRQHHQDQQPTHPSPQGILPLPLQLLLCPPNGTNGRRLSTTPSLAYRKSCKYYSHLIQHLTGQNKQTNKQTRRDSSSESVYVRGKGRITGQQEKVESWERRDESEKRKGSSFLVPLSDNLLPGQIHLLYKSWRKRSRREKKESASFFIHYRHMHNIIFFSHLHKLIPFSIWQIINLWQ